MSLGDRLQRLEQQHGDGRDELRVEVWHPSVDRPGWLVNAKTGQQRHAAQMGADGSLQVTLNIDRASSGWEDAGRE